MLATVAFGIWLVADSAAWDFGQTWIVLALALFGVLPLVGAGFQSRVAISVERAAAAGDHAETARLLRRWTWGMLVMIAVLLVIAWDMVFKPGL
jgi:uncharacterized membrane protein